MSPAPVSTQQMPTQVATQQMPTQGPTQQMPTQQMPTQVPTEGQVPVSQGSMNGTQPKLPVAAVPPTIFSAFENVPTKPRQSSDFWGSMVSESGKLNEFVPMPSKSQVHAYPQSFVEEETKTKPEVKRPATIDGWLASVTVGNFFEGRKSTARTQRNTAHPAAGSEAPAFQEAKQAPQTLDQWLMDGMVIGHAKIITEDRSREAAMRKAETAIATQNSTRVQNVLEWQKAEEVRKHQERIRQVEKEAEERIQEQLKQQELLRQKMALDQRRYEENIQRIREAEEEQEKQMQRKYSEQALHLQQAAAERQRQYEEEHHAAHQRYLDYLAGIPPPPPDLLIPPPLPPPKPPPGEPYWAWLARIQGPQAQTTMGNGRLVVSSSLLKF